MPVTLESSMTHHVLIVYLVVVGNVSRNAIVNTNPKSKSSKTSKNNMEVFLEGRCN